MDSLCVKNFGPIKEVNLDIKDLVVFIGKQGTGKSTLAKLLSILKNEAFLVSISNEVEKKILEENDSPINFFNKYNISNYFDDNSYIKFTTKNYSVEFSNRKFSLDIHKKFLKNDREIHSLLLNSSMIGDLLNRMVNEGDNKNKENSTILFENFINYKKISRALNTEQVYIPAERIFVSSLSTSDLLSLTHSKLVSESIYDFASMYYKSIESIKEFDLPIFDLKFENDSKSQYISSKNTKKLKLSETASGYQSIIPMLLIIDFNSNKKSKFSKNYVIEEPELSLFPEYQHKLIKHLVKECLKKNGKNNSNNLIITTHSPYILTSINNLLFADIITKEKENKSEDVYKIIDKDSILDSDNISVFILEDGTAKSIINPYTKLIADNDLDSASENILDEYSDLMEIYRSND